MEGVRRSRMGVIRAAAATGAVQPQVEEAQFVTRVLVTDCFFFCMGGMCQKAVPMSPGVLTREF